MEVHYCSYTIYTVNPKQLLVKGEEELSGGFVSIRYRRLVEMIVWMHGKS